MVVAPSVLVGLVCAGCGASAERAAPPGEVAGPLDEVVVAPSGDAVDEGEGQGERITADELHDEFRGFDFASGDVESLERDLASFYGVDGRLAREVVAWAVVRNQVEGSSDGSVVIRGIESVTTTAEGVSGVLVVDGGSGSPAEGRLPFWMSAQRGLLVSSMPVQGAESHLGPELAADADWALPDEGLVVLANGTVGFLAVDGTPLGHVPASLMDGESGSLVDWLAAGDRRIKPFAAMTDDYPCSEADSLDGGHVELCARREGIIPTFELDGTELIIERHWQALYEESGWDWDEATAQVGVVGHYVAAAQDPASGAWLLDWSGECESRDALLFHQDRLQHVTGLVWEEAPSAEALGWVGGSAIYTTRTDLLCGTGAEEAAVYAKQPDGPATAIWSTSGELPPVLVFTS